MLSYLSLLFRTHRLQRLDLPRDQRRGRRAVAEQYSVARKCRRLGAGGQVAGEIERIGGGAGDAFAPRGPLARVAQTADRFGQCELFPRVALHETAAAQFAARLHAAVDVEQFAPRRQLAFALQYLSEHHAVAAQQGAGDVFDAFAVALRRYGLAEQFPAAGLVDARAAAAAGVAAGAGLAQRGREERAQARVAVSGDEAARGEVAQGLFHLGAQHAGVVPEVDEERRAELLQRVRDFLRRRGEIALLDIGRAAAPMAHVLARQQRDGRHAHRRGLALLVAFVFRWLQTQPCEMARAAEAVEHLRVITFDARRQDVGLPGGGGYGVAFQLLQHRRERLAALAARLAEVLPAQQEAHEVGRTDRFDLAAELLHGVTMNAREQAAFAPLDLLRAAGIAALQYVAFLFERGERKVDLCKRHAQWHGELCRGHRAETFETAAHDFAQRIIGIP